MPTEQGLMLVPAVINNDPKLMLLDTGGVIRQISRATVEALKLREHDSPLKLFDVKGDISQTYAEIGEFALGPIKLENAQFQVMADPNFGKGSPPIAGLLSIDFFQYYDMDFDFAAGRLNLFSPDHCEGKVVYWPAENIAAVPITLDKNHVTVPVTLDGQHPKAIIDTGASISTISMDVATRVFSLTPQSPDMKAMGQITNGENTTAYQHSFSNLSFEGVAVNNPRVTILPDVMNRKDRNNTLQTGSHISSVDDSVVLPEVIIGMDVLKKLHLYVAFKERKLYISEAGGATSSLPPPIQASAKAP